MILLFFILICANLHAKAFTALPHSFDFEIATEGSKFGFSFHKSCYAIIFSVWLSSVAYCAKKRISKYNFAGPVDNFVVSGVIYDSTTDTQGVICSDNFFNRIDR
jgi:hypothetical protein